MTDMPEMVPSAAERRRDVLVYGFNSIALFRENDKRIEAALTTAYRDGWEARDKRYDQQVDVAMEGSVKRYPTALALEYAHSSRWPDDRVDLARLHDGFAKAERERIIAVLREPNGELRAAVMKPIGNTIGMGEDEVDTALRVMRAIADHLDHQP